MQAGGYTEVIRMVSAAVEAPGLAFATGRVDYSYAPAISALQLLSDSLNK